MTTVGAVVNQLKLPNKIRLATVIVSILVGTRLISRPASSRTAGLSLTKMALRISHTVSHAYEMEVVFPKAMQQAVKVKTLVAAGVDRVKIQEQLGMSKASYYRCLKA